MPTHIKNVLILAISQALFTSTTSMMITIGGLVGYKLAENKALATLPFSMVIVGLAVSTIPASLLMRRVGRRTGFLIGSAMGATAALLNALAVYHGSFWMLALGALLAGVYGAFGQLYRFAAVDSTPLHFQSRAISFVLAGGLLAGFMGPQIAKWSREWMEVIYVGNYVAIAMLAASSLLFLVFLDIPKPKAEDLQGPQRPILKIMLQPVFLVAAFSAMVGYAVMALIMTGTPLAMVAYDFAFNDAATVIQWHVVAMFLPSFFTGSIILRIGVLRVIMLGVLLNAACIVIALSGTSMLNFWLALSLLGVGWNFMFIGGTTLLTRAYTVAERPKAQAANDFMVFGSQALASLSAGPLLYLLGWEMVVWTGVPFVVMAGLATLWLAMRQGVDPAPVSLGQQEPGSPVPASVGG